MDKTLDANANYVIATGGQFGGHNLTATTPIKIVDEPARPAEFTAEQAEQLLVAGKIQLADDVRPTPVESPEDAVRRLAEIEAMDEGKFLIRAPWLAEAETVEGKEAAEVRFRNVILEGLKVYQAAEASAAETLSPANAASVAGAALTGSDGFQMIESGSNGYYDVVAPGREPERVRGKAKAEARLAELRVEAATPPIEPPVVDPETLDPDGGDAGGTGSDGETDRDPGSSEG